MSLSLSEIVIMLLVSLFILKPEDLPVIFKKLGEIRNYILGIKEEVLGSVSKELDIDLKDDLEVMNRYLAKIIEVDGEYHGPYDLASVKKKHKSLIKKQKNAK